MRIDFYAMEGGFFMQNQNKLTFHTTLDRENKTITPVPDTPDKPIKAKPKIKKTHAARLSPSERLFKNTAIACGLLLTVMALKNIDTPVTNKITTAVKSVVSMDLDLPSSVGSLSFVQKFMPESALVFLNMTDTKQKALPVKGEIVHPYSEKQPWTEYKTLDNAPVYSITEGKVEACVQTEEGDFTILIRNPDGTECVYAFLHQVSVRTGDSIDMGDPLGLTGANDKARLYFEVRKNGSAINYEELSEK